MFNPEIASDRETMNRLYDLSLLYDRWIEPPERDWEDERDEDTLEEIEQSRLFGRIQS